MKTIIFDFDGTIVDSTKLLCESLNLVAKNHGYKEIDMKAFKEKPIRELKDEMKISFLKLPFILREFKRNYKKKMMEVKLFKNIIPILKRLSKNNSIGILTTNDEDVVNKLLGKNIELFDFVYCGSGVFGKSSILKKIIKKHNLDLDDTFYVGDETRDIEAAKKVNIKSVAVTWGLNSKKLLKNNKPDIILDTPIKLLEL
jgi:HAD superfamily hydrolase (TIGR01549 family)